MPNSCSKASVTPHQSQEKSQAAQHDIQGLSSPVSGALLTSQLKVQPDQTNLDMTPETHQLLFHLHRGCSFFSPTKLLCMLQNPVAGTLPQ